jgi:membrane protease YdiL (CAAX protease family)
MDYPAAAPPPPPLPDLPSPRQARRNVPSWLQLAAVILGVGPLYVFIFISGLTALQTGDYQLRAADLISGVVVMAVFGLFLVSLLLILGERLSDLQLGPGKVISDMGSGILLTLLIFGMLIMLRLAQAGLEGLGLIPKGPNVPEANLEMVASIASDPLLLFLFLGPVIWIQAAVIEELTRVFVLSRLWKVWPAPRAKALALYVWSAIFGLAHIYQGAIGVVGTAMIGLLLGSYYLGRGRVLPLIIAHGLYDTLATLALLYAVRHPELLPAALL